MPDILIAQYNIVENIYTSISFFSITNYYDNYTCKQYGKPVSLLEKANTLARIADENDDKLYKKQYSYIVVYPHLILLIIIFFCVCFVSDSSSKI